MNPYTKRYTLSLAESRLHVPAHIDRTAHRPCRGMLNFDVEYQVWSNRAAMARTIRMQERGEPDRYRWEACEALGPTEGI